MKKLHTGLFLFGLISCNISYAQWGGYYFGATTVNTGNLDIAVQPFRETSPAVGLQNRSDKPAQCSATFSNGPQFSETRRATIAPGKNATLAYPVHYITARVDIDVRCSEQGQGQR